MKLHASTAALVKKWMPAFLASVKKDGPFPYPPTIELLPMYVDFLGTKEKKFKNIQAVALNTAYKGVYEIYNNLRKKVEKLDEKAQVARAAD